MPELPKRSFSEVTIVEAIARLAGVCLVVRPLRPGPERRLSSRFLGMEADGKPILSVPAAEGPKNRKVFLPVGCDVGMVFQVGELLLQAVTRVVGHCHHQQYPSRRVEAIIVARPMKVTELSRRGNPRWEIDPSEQIAASVWAAQGLAPGSLVAPRLGQLVNWSADGFGVSLPKPLPCQAGTEMIIRLEGRRIREFPIYRGVLKHCTPRSDGQFLAGFGEVVELRPGQAVNVMESLASPRSAPVAASDSEGA
jgi:hypothetical protein